MSAPVPSRGPAAGPAGWARAAALVGLAAVLWAAGHETLPAPPLHRPSGLDAWAGALGPAGVAMALVRVGAVTGAALLGLATGLHLVARSHLLARSRAAALGALADRLVPAAARPLVHGLAGISLTAGVSVAGAWSSSTGEPVSSAVEVDGATMHRLPPGAEVMRRVPAGPVEWMRVAPRPGATAVLRSLEGDLDPDDTGTGDEPHGPAVLRVIDGTDTWRVEAGDSFWSIATEVVAEVLDRPPGDAEVAPYWTELVEANRDRLVTADPDLIYPGQDLRLPPVHA